MKITLMKPIKCAFSLKHLLQSIIPYFLTIPFHALQNLQWRESLPYFRGCTRYNLFGISWISVYCQEFDKKNKEKSLFIINISLFIFLLNNDFFSQAKKNYFF